MAIPSAPWALYSKSTDRLHPAFALATFFTGITPFILQRYSKECFEVEVFGRYAKDIGNLNNYTIQQDSLVKTFHHIKYLFSPKPSAVRLTLVTGSFIKHVKKSLLCRPLECRSIQTEPICRCCFKFCPKFLLQRILTRTLPCPYCAFRLLP